MFGGFEGWICWGLGILWVSSLLYEGNFVGCLDEGGFDGSYWIGINGWDFWLVYWLVWRMLIIIKCKLGGSMINGEWRVFEWLDGGLMGKDVGIKGLRGGVVWLLFWFGLWFIYGYL